MTLQRRHKFFYFAIFNNFDENDPFPCDLKLT